MELTEEEKEQERLEEEIYRWAEEYAEEHGWSLNYEEKQLRAVIRGLARNLARHGEKYCPCRIRSGNSEADREIICPCVYHEEEIEKMGHCHCNLFFDDEFFRRLMITGTPPEPPLVDEE